MDIVAVGRHSLPSATSNIKPSKCMNVARRLVLALLAVNSVGRQSSLGHGGSGIEGGGTRPWTKYSAFSEKRQGGRLAR
jgi:hypothetical protein